MENYYEILEISPKASDEVIKMAYKALVKKYHPDVFSGSPEVANQKMQEINKAYEVLSDLRKRKAYDSTIKLSNLTQDEDGDESNSSYQTTREAESTEDSDSKGSGCLSSIMAALFIVFIIPVGVNFVIKKLLWMIKNEQKRKEISITITIILFAAILLWVLKI